MEVDIFVHGVPNGFRYWGDGADKDYFETFYNESAKEIMFQIQTRKSGGKAYCYYHYLAYNNVVAHDGRAGSYFGLSLRIDAFYKDALNIYRMLDILYNTYIVGDILQPMQGKMKYSVPDFAPISSKLENLEKEVVHFLEKTRPDNYLSLQGFPTTSSKCFAYNLLDCTSEIILGAVKQNGVVVISPYYERKSEQDLKRKCEEEVQNAKKQCDLTLASKDRECLAQINKIKEDCDASLKANGSVLKKAQVDLAQALKDKSGLEQSLKEKAEELKDIRAKMATQIQNKKIEDIVGPIQKPINQLAEAIKELMPAKTEDPGQDIDPAKRRIDWSKLFSWQFLSFVIVGIILVLSLLSFNSIRKGLDALQSDVSNLKTAIIPPDPDTTLETTKEEVVETGMVEEEQSEDLEKIPIVQEPPRIDIQNYNGKDPLKIGMTYIVSLQNSKVKGTWDYKGASCSETDDPFVIKLIPKESSVTISYFVLGKPIVSRTIPAKNP